MEKNTWYMDLAPEFDSWFSCWLYFIHFYPTCNGWFHCWVVILSTSWCLLNILRWFHPSFDGLVVLLVRKKRQKVDTPKMRSLLPESNPTMSSIFILSLRNISAHALVVRQDVGHRLGRDLRLLGVADHQASLFEDVLGQQPGVREIVMSKLKTFLSQAQQVRNSIQGHAWWWITFFLLWYTVEGIQFF